MADLRELLQKAAGDRPTAVPLTDIRRRGSALVWRRRTIAGVIVALMAIALGVALNTYHPTSSTPLTPPPPPSPVVTPGTLRPGTYVARTLSPNVTFTVPEGPPWRVSLATAGSLALTNDSRQITMLLEHWARVYPPGAGTGTPSPRPPDVISWLTAHPGLKIAGHAAAVRFGNRPAHRVTFTVNAHRQLPTGPAVGCTAGKDCVVLADTSDNPVVVYSWNTTTIIAADDDPTGLVLTIARRTDQTTDTTPLVAIRSID
jgi:hypothetical protein